MSSDLVIEVSPKDAGIGAGGLSIFVRVPKRLTGVKGKPFRYKDFWQKDVQFAVGFRTKSDETEFNCWVPLCKPLPKPFSSS